MFNLCLCPNAASSNVGPTPAHCRNQPKLLDDFIKRNILRHTANCFDYLFPIGHRLNATDSFTVEQGRQCRARCTSDTLICLVHLMCASFGSVHVISKKAARLFWEKYPDSETPLCV